MSKFSELGHRLYTGEASYDFIGRRRRWYVVSAVLLLISLGALAIRGLDFGIEFEGGADFRAPVTVNSQTVDEMRSALKSSGVPELEDANVNTIGSDQIRVQTRTLDPTVEVPKVRAAIGEQVGVPADQVAYNLIGASWGEQITERALIALVVFLVLVGLMIWIYFRNAAMSIAALVALGHDLILTIGIYALVGFTVTPATLIGVLTILGYSLYDTVVVFDKVRENVRDLRSSTTRTYSEAANLAVNQVLVRSINTTVIGVLPVAALLFTGAFILGEGPLKDLALALFVGMISGAYSSIFIATPLLAQIQERNPEMQKLAARVASRRAKEASRGRGADGKRSAGQDAHTSPDGAEGTGGTDADRESAPALTVTRAAAGTVPVRPVSEGASRRPQPQHKPRSQRRS
nr:protein translocase subunit SecF [uncultured Friedmanniella sp.]